MVDSLQSLRHTPNPVPIAYGAPTEEGRGTFTKLKPLRWRFLTNKAPRTKFMCMACAEKRQAPQKFEPTVNLDSSWDGQKVEPPLKLEHLESHDNGRQQRRSRSVQQNTRVQSQKREKLQERQPERRESRASTQEPLSSNGRRRGPSQAPETQRDRRSSGVLHPFANHRVSRESHMRTRPASTIESRMGKQRGSVETPTRPRKSSNSQSEPRGSEKKGQRLSSTADILGMSRSLELPPNYFDMSSSSPTFTAASEPEHDNVDWRQLEMQMPRVERKTNETEEERQRRRSASYAHMLLRMRRHYDTVQVNGTHSHPTTAPPRRIRAERRAKSVAVRSANAEEAVKIDPANVAIDLDYLRAYKNAR
ncbi:hypothetical protein DVH05_007486 [Phytophthora capsici]|nr:hypothetical protein DVH05_007486 [Phytophthora capsici]